MGRAKLKRFNEISGRDNVLQENAPLYSKLKGNWNRDYFRTYQPITIEMGCGKGEYTVGLARLNPDQNYVGVDIKGDRLWAGSTMCIDEGIHNAAFLRAQIQHIDQFFQEDEVSSIWITFPDPRPRDRDIKRRLTSPRYLEMYRRILRPQGWVYFKTDNQKLFEYTLEVLEERTDIRNLSYTFDLYNSEYVHEHHGIQTTFEKKYLAKGIRIKYLKFRFQ